MSRLAALAALALAGCAAVGPNFERPAPPAAAGYAMAGDPTPRLASLPASAAPGGRWWLALGSARLDAVIDEALAVSPTLAAADATLARARALAGEAKGALAPRADLAASAERERINLQAFGFNAFPNPTITLYSVGGTVAYDLDLFGGGRRRLEAARAEGEVQQWRASAARLTLSGDIALRAAAIAGLRARLAALDAVIADDEANIALVRAAQAAGGEARSATRGGEAQLAADLALAPPLRQQLAAERHALALLVGRSPASWTAPDFDIGEFALAPAPVSLPAALARQRPDILAAEAAWHVDIARVGVATADLYPDIRLTANFTQSALTPGGLISYDASGWAIGPQLSLPLFNGGALRAARRAAVEQARASLADYRRVVLAAFVQVSDALAALAHDEQELAAEARAQAAARAALADARAAYRLGGGASLAVLDAQRQLDRARFEAAAARGQQLADLIRLHAATAGDWPSDPG